MKKLLVGLLSIVLALGLFVVLDDYRFWQRYITILSNKGAMPMLSWGDALYTVEAAPFKALPAETATEPAIFSALQTMDTYAAERASSALLVWQQDRLIYQQYYGDYDANALINGKSMAKMVLSIAYGRALQLGVIESLDQPAADYIDEWRGTDKAAISLRHILQMATGFERFYTQTFNPFDKFVRSYISSEHEQVMLNDYPLINEPGTVYDYSQVSSDLLGLILERASGMPYGEFLAQELLQKIGATGGFQAMNRPDGIAHSGCCLYLPAESWMRLAILVLNQGQYQQQQLLDPRWLSDVVKPSPGNTAMGLHFWLGKPYYEYRGFAKPGLDPNFGIYHSEPYLADDLLMFDGNSNQVIYIIPSEDLIVMRTAGDSRSTLPWDNAFLPNTLLRVLNNSATNQ